MDPEKFAYVLDKYFKKSLASCPQGLPAQIVQVHPQSAKADVKIPWLLSLPDFSSLEVPVIPNVRFLHAIDKSIRVSPIYERGDYVWLSFSSFDLQIDKAQRTIPLSLSLHNAVIVGHFVPLEIDPLFDPSADASSPTNLLQIHTWRLQAHPVSGILLNAPCKLGSAPQPTLLYNPVQAAFRVFTQQILALPPITPADGGAAFKTALHLAVQNLAQSIELAASKEIFVS